MELLSPVGNMDMLHAAIQGGCDAVYIGMKDFGARKYATNFTKEEIKEATLICHLYGVRIYITLNTVIKDNEVSSFLDLVDYLYHIGVDAFIMQDFGMICMVLEMYPDMEVHASTQFNNSSLRTIQLLKDLGVKRVVLSREISLDDIKKIDIDIEKEVFVHGALCISYSGNCLFSSMLGNRSGNRGECTGCCRLPYTLYKNSQFVKSGYLLSTKELNTSSKFSELLDASIDSFKIEGRMKSREYVYFVTRLYRRLIDGESYTKEDIDILSILYNREFTLGHLFSSSIVNAKTSNHIGLKVGRVMQVTKDKLKIQLDHPLHQEDGIRFFKSGYGMNINFLYNKNHLLVREAEDICYIKNNVHLKELDDVYLTSSKYLSKVMESNVKRRIPIKIEFSAKIGSLAVLKISDFKREVCVYGDVVEKAKSTPITENDILKKLGKIKESVYEIIESDIHIDSNIFIPIHILNVMRREGIEKLNKKRCEVKRNMKKNPIFPLLDVKVTNYNTIVIENEEELAQVLSYKRIYTSNFSLFNKYKEKLNIYYIEKRNIFDKEIHDRSLVGEYCYSKNSISDYSMNVTNIYSVYYLLKLGYTCITLSVELSDVEVKMLIEDFYQKFKFYPNVEVVCRDKIELMLIKGNILDVKENEKYFLLDHKKRKFDVFFDDEFTHILNFEVINRENIDKCNKRYNFKYLK